MKNLNTRIKLLFFMFYSIQAISQPVLNKPLKKIIQNKEFNATTNLECPIGYKVGASNCELIVETNQGILKRWMPMNQNPSKESYPIKDGLLNNRKVTMDKNEVNQKLNTLLAGVYNIKKTEIRFLDNKPVLYCLAISYQIEAEQVITIPLIQANVSLLITTDLVTITIKHKGKITTRTEANTAFQQNDYVGHVTLLR